METIAAVARTMPAKKVGFTGVVQKISYFTLMSSEIHYYDIIEKIGSWTLMSSEV